MVLLVLGGVLLAVTVLWLVGTSLPREHRASCRATFRAGPAALFALLADVDAYPEWRAGVKSVRRLEPLDGKPAFVEEAGDGPVRYAVERDEPPHTRVVRIADDELPYGGTWTFSLTPSAQGTTLTITEDGFVEPALFRALARLVFGYHANLEAYLTSVARKLGETVTIERV